MGDVNETPLPPRRRSGCLKWTCGCLVVFLVVTIGVGYLLYRHLSTWRPGESAWENLPATALWAVEVHDVGGLVSRAAADPGFVSFLNAATTALNTFFLSEDVEGHPEEVLPKSLYMYQHLGFFQRLLIPNAFLVGGTGPGSDNAFVIVQPPVWAGYVLGLTGQATVERLEDDETDIFYARNDGWLVLGLNEAVVQSVLDGWNSRALPLGLRADRRDAYIALALKPEAAAPAAPEPGPGHFTFADPFATATTPAATAEPGVRMLLVPEAAAWRVFGEAVPNGAWTNVTLSSLGDALPDTAPLRTSAFDIALSARAAPEVAATLRQRLAARVATAAGGSPALLAWLNGGWLEQAGDEATLLAAAPVATDAPYPGLPVVALGWGVKESVAVRDAAERFASTLGAWTGELRSSSTDPLVQGATAGIEATVDADGLGGRLAVPPVLVSGARPGWRFSEAGRGTGWFATDASALDTLPVASDLPLADLPPAEAGRAEIAGAWALGPDMVDGTRKWLWDRFEMSRAYGRLDDDGRRVAKLIADLTAHLFTAYPRGQVRVGYDQASGRGGFVGRVPYGAGR